jgi:hypothetical protein
MFKVFISHFYLKAQSNPWNKEKAPLQRVTSNHFKITTIPESCTAQEFQKKHDLRINAPNIFIECTTYTTITKDLRDVMLMDKVILWA